MGWRRSKTGWTLLSAAAVAVMFSIGTVLWQPEVTGQDRASQVQADQEKGSAPRTTASEREAAPAAKQHANSLSLAFRRAAELATPSVVRIDAHTNARQVRGSRNDTPLRQRNPFEGTPWEDMFRGFDFPDDLQGRIPQRDGMGSGVIIDPKGVVVTNNHVVSGADRVTVSLSDGREFVATEIKTDPASDLAVLWLKDAKNLPAARLGDSAQLEIGDWVLAIGNPFGQNNTVSAGIISGKGRQLLNRVERASFLQTDAAINPGNSGGPLVNLEGEVVGINTAIASNSGGYQGIGFAIPVNLARWVTDQLVQRGSVERGYLGVKIREVTPELAAEMRIRPRQGVVVTEVMPGSPAAEAGVQEYDVIVAFNGVAVNSSRALQEAVEQSTLGQRRSLTVIRDGNERKLDLIVKALPQSESIAQRNEEPEEEPVEEGTYRDKKLGIDVANLSRGQATQFEGQQGVIIQRVEPDSAAAREGLRRGMLIRAVGRKPVKSVDDYAEAIEKNLDQNGVLLSVRTGAGNQLVVINPDEE
jgi:serine protease Do